MQGVSVGAGGNVLAMDTHDYGGIFAYQGMNGSLIADNNPQEIAFDNLGNCL